MTRGFVLICSLILTAGVCRAQDPDMGTEAQRKAGKVIYEHKCAQCHGDNGDGNGVAAAFFRPAPRDLTAATYKIRTTESGALPTDDDLKAVIRKGMPYTGMPAWPGLSEHELSNVVYYMKTFVEDFADPEAIEPVIKIPRAPRFSEASVQRGQELYEENKCADCHGTLGRGYGKSSATLKDDFDKPIRPADMTKRWTFRGGSTREDIYRTFTTGLNGTPMPSYADLIETEDRWHLVDYVYSFSRDEPEYSTLVIASGIEAEINLDQGETLFEDAPPAFFPVVGQVIEPGRNFYPSANAVEVRAVYNATDIAIMLVWHDMTGETSGTNGPSMPVPRFDPDAEEEAGAIYSDAVAVQTPSKKLSGSVKPYFLFGDTKNAVDIWFADLAKGEGEFFVGRGSQNIESGQDAIPVRSAYRDGAWNVIFKRSRFPADGLSFDEGSFVPVAFSIWDGFAGERGNKRGVTSWYHLYLQPLREDSKAIPVAGYGILALLVELVVIQVVRKRNGASPRRHGETEVADA